MKNRHRRDDNQKEIITGLRSSGFTVHDISQVDGGCGDILAGKNHRTWLFEIKDPDQVKLTPDEKKFSRKWKGQWAIITSLEEALQITGMRGERPNYPKSKPCYNYRPGLTCIYGWRLVCSGCQYRHGVRV